MSSRADDEPEGEPEPQPKRWGLGVAVAGYLLSFLLTAVTAGIYAALADLEPGERSLGLLAAALVGLWLGMATAVLYATRLQPGGTLRSEMRLRFERVDLAIGAVAGLGMQFVILPILYLPGYLFVDDFADKLNDPAERLTEVAKGPAYLVLGVLLAVGAPFIEELFFRGLVQQALLRRLRPAVAIGLSALLFGLAHFAWITVPGLTAFGVVVGVLVYRTGRLGPAIATHFFFNLATVIAMA